MNSDETSNPQGEPCCKDNLDEWFRSSTDRRDGLAFTAQDPKEVTFANVNGEAIFEGDIVLGSVDEAEQRLAEHRRGSLVTEGLVIRGDRFRWKDGVVPVVIQDDLPNQKRVTDAIRHWEQKTPLRFPKRINETDYISFRPGGGCSSMVGRQGGRQFITLAPGCLFGAVVHEIGHAVGLWHEQSRADRDNFIEVKFENIVSGMEHNFRQQISNGIMAGEYDYRSIMHYPEKAFSKNGRATIVPRSGHSIGQRDGLSAGDIAAVRSIYPNLAW